MPQDWYSYDDDWHSYDESSFPELSGINMYNPPPEEEPWYKRALTVPTAIRTGSSILGDYLSGPGALAGARLGARGGVPGVAIGATLGAALPKFVGGFVGEMGGREYEGNPFNLPVNTVEGILNLLPGPKTPGRGAGIGDAVKYLGKSVGYGAGQGLLGAVPRHMANEDQVLDPTSMTGLNLPSWADTAAETAGGGVFGGLFGAGLGLPHMAYENLRAPRVGESQIGQDISGLFGQKLNPIDQGHFDLQGPEVGPYGTGEGQQGLPFPQQKPHIDAATFAAMRDAPPPPQGPLTQGSMFGEGEGLMPPPPPAAPPPNGGMPILPQQAPAPPTTQMPAGQPPPGSTLSPDGNVVTIHAPDASLTEYWRGRGYISVPGMRSPDGRVQMVRGDVAPLYVTGDRRAPSMPPAQTVTQQRPEVPGPIREGMLRVAPGQPIPIPIANINDELVANMAARGYSESSRGETHALFTPIGSAVTTPKSTGPSIMDRLRGQRGAVDLDSISRTLGIGDEEQTPTSDVGGLRQQSVLNGGGVGGTPLPMPPAPAPVAQPKQISMESLMQDDHARHFIENNHNLPQELQNPQAYQGLADMTKRFLEDERGTMNPNEIVNGLRAMINGEPIPQRAEVESQVREQLTPEETQRAKEALHASTASRSPINPNAGTLISPTNPNESSQSIAARRSLYAVDAREIDENTNLDEGQRILDFWNEQVDQANGTDPEGEQHAASMMQRAINRLNEIEGTPTTTSAPKAIPSTPEQQALVNSVKFDDAEPHEIVGAWQTSDLDKLQERWTRVHEAATITGNEQVAKYAEQLVNLAQSRRLDIEDSGYPQQHDPTLLRQLYKTIRDTKAARVVPEAPIEERLQSYNTIRDAVNATTRTQLERMHEAAEDLHNYSVQQGNDSIAEQAATLMELVNSRIDGDTVRPADSTAINRAVASLEKDATIEVIDTRSGKVIARFTSSWDARDFVTERNGDQFMEVRDIDKIKKIHPEVERINDLTDPDELIKLEKEWKDKYEHIYRANITNDERQHIREMHDAIRRRINTLDEELSYEEKKQLPALRAALGTPNPPIQFGLQPEVSLKALKDEGISPTQHKRLAAGAGRSDLKRAAELTESDQRFGTWDNFADGELRSAGDGPPGLSIEDKTARTDYMGRPRPEPFDKNYQITYRAPDGKPVATAKVFENGTTGLRRVPILASDRFRGILGQRGAMQVGLALMRMNAGEQKGTISQYTAHLISALARFVKDTSGSYEIGKVTKELQRMKELYLSRRNSNFEAPGDAARLLNRMAENSPRLRNLIGNEQGALKIPSWQGIKKATGWGQGGEGGLGKDEFNFIKEALAVPSNATTTLDLSAPGRQGLSMFLTPEFWKAGGAMLKGLSAKGFDQIDAELHSKDIMIKPVDPVTGKEGKSFAEEIGTKVFSPASRPGPRAEATASRWLEMGIGKTTTDAAGNKTWQPTLGSKAWANTVGAPIRMSNRAYITFLNHLNINRTEKLLNLARDMSVEALDKGKVRQGMMPWKTKFGAAAAQDLNPYHNIQLGKEIADFVNTATGHAPLKFHYLPLKQAEINLEFASKALSAALFSPGLLFSRIRMMNPNTYIMASPFVRKQYLKAAISTAAAWGVFTTMAKLAGGDEVSINDDITSADYGKTRIGDTRFDPGGGFLQFAAAYGRLYAGGKTSSSSNRFQRYGAGYQAETVKDMGERFMVNKLNPVTKFAYDIANASENNPFHVGDRTLQLFVPLIVQDLVELNKEKPELLGMGIPIALGVGSQIYSKGESVSKFIDKENDWNVTGGGGLRSLMPWNLGEQQ